MMPKNMMPTTMPGMEASPLFWVVLGVLLFLILMATCIWLAAHWLKQRKMLAMQYTSQPKDDYEDYQQGYRAQQPLPETYEEGEQRYPYPLYEQPQAQQLEQMPLQR